MYGKKRRNAGIASLEGKRVLITGGLGSIGSNIAHTCVALGAKVTVYDCLDPKSGGNMYNLRGVQDNLNIILNDIRNFEGVCAAILNQDIVFHCAAYTSHPNSMREPLIDIDVNCKGTINILEAARRFSPLATIVHVGTSTQIGRMVGKRSITELHPEFPLDIYSANKSVSEKYTLIYHTSYGLKTTVVRLPNVYGPRSHIATADIGFINYFIGLALQKKNITVYGTGQQLRSLVYVDDAVDALVRAAQNPKSIGEVFFVSSDEQYSIMEIARTITKIMGGKTSRVDWPKERKRIEIGDAVISNKKIKKVLSWKPHHSFTAGLKKTYDYYSPCLSQYLP